MALVYGIDGVSFRTKQTVCFVFSGDLIPEHRRGQLLSRYNAVMTLTWGLAGALTGDSLAGIQVKSLDLQAYAAYVNTFYASSIILAFGHSSLCGEGCRVQT
jgi:hypothetical protein